MIKFLLPTVIFVILSWQMFAQQAHFTKYNQFPTTVKEINCIYPQNDSVLWIGTNANLLKISNDNIIEFRDTNNLAKFTINSIVEDTNNDIWMGNYVGSLLKVGISVDHTSETSFSHLLNDEVQLITSMYTKNDIIWAGTSEGKVFWYNIRTEEQDTIPLPVQSEIYSLYVDEDDRLWICTDKGLYRSLGDNKWKKIKKLSEAYRIIYIDNTFWVVGRDDLNQTVLLFSDYDNLIVFGFDVVFSAWSRLLLQGIPDVYLKYNDIDFDSKGNIWIAYNDGLIRYNPFVDDFDEFNSEKYPEFTISPIKKVTLQKDNVIWVSSVDEIIKIVLDE